jgi:hypothetical protein
MRDSTHIVATLEIDLGRLENLPERIFALVPHIADKGAKHDCVELAREIGSMAARMRERVEELKGDA